MSNNPTPDQGGDDFVFKVVIIGVAILTGGNWLAGNLAALIGRGRVLHAGFSQALAALVPLPAHAHDPAWFSSPCWAVGLPC